MLELDGVKRERDYVYERLKFEGTEEQHEFLERKGMGSNS
jgi:hypothetical protein